MGHTESLWQLRNLYLDLNESYTSAYMCKNALVELLNVSWLLWNMFELNGFKWKFSTKEVELWSIRDEHHSSMYGELVLGNNSKHRYCVIIFISCKSCQTSSSFMHGIFKFVWILHHKTLTYMNTPAIPISGERNTFSETSSLISR
jgi:hypothetical protein